MQYQYSVGKSCLRLTTFSQASCAIEKNKIQVPGPGELTEMYFFKATYRNNLISPASRMDFKKKHTVL